MGVFQGSKWSDGQIIGKVYEGWVSWGNIPRTGVVAGEIIGTFDPNESTFQMLAMVPWMDTNTFMNMVDRGQTADLEALNIPCVEIGNASLTGSGNNLTVNMNDVTFFAYSTGDALRIWATKDVSGTYRAAPTIDVPINLSSGGLSADFIPKRWDSNVWGATVDGSGTLTRADISGTTNINFKGGAAGTYGGGAFSGTGAGVANTQSQLPQ